MDLSATDRLSRSVRRAATRRTLLGRIAPTAAALLAVAGLPAAPVTAKKKKGCKFDKTGTVWTLRKSCSLKKTLNIPNNVTLDGAGLTITGKGNRNNFREGLIQNSGPAMGVRNLTLDGSGITGCVLQKPLHGIFVEAAVTTIEDSTFTGHCGWAIEPSSSSPDKAVTVRRCDVDATASFKGGIVSRRGTIDACTVTGGPRGISVSVDDLVGTTVSSNTVTGATVGIEVSDGKAAISGNTIVGPGEVAGRTVGIDLDNALGSVTGNSVSNYVSSTETGYGILQDAGSCTVTISANTFPDPPGNDDDFNDDACN